MGVLVIDTAASSRHRHALALAPVIDAVREHLRASDVLGRLKDGELAALLVHTGSRGLEVVAARLARRLARLAQDQRGPAPILGRAAYPGAGETVQALVEAARTDWERRGMWAAG
jgi:hypothetical protein